jgi:hypothetical protein
LERANQLTVDRPCVAVSADAIDKVSGHEATRMKFKFVVSTLPASHGSLQFFFREMKKRKMIISFFYSKFTPFCWLLTALMYLTLTGNLLQFFQMLFHHKSPRWDLT